MRILNYFLLAVLLTGCGNVFGDKAKDRFKLQMQSAKEGNVGAQTALGEMYLRGYGVSINYQEAVKWFRLAADQGDPFAQYNLGLMYQDGTGVNKDYQEARKWFQMAADQGHPSAKLSLTSLNSHQEEVKETHDKTDNPQDTAKDSEGPSSYLQEEEVVIRKRSNNSQRAPKNLSERPRRRKSQSQVNLGSQGRKDVLAEKFSRLKLVGSHGLIQPKTDKEYFKLYQLPAEMGNINAQFIVGSAYANGKGVPKDDRKAVRWFLRAAEQGDVDAQLFLGAAYENGKGVHQDSQLALKWYRLAAEKGHVEAYLAIASMYRNGIGIPKDQKEANKWYRLLGEQGKQGDSEAQYVLGDAYSNGHGLPLDDVKAIKWYRLAAEQGHPYAQSSLGAAYSNGDGVPEDSVEAYKWFSLAIANGFEGATYNRDRVAKQMSLSQIQEAKRLTREWKPSSNQIEQGDAIAQRALGRKTGEEIDSGQGTLNSQELEQKVSPAVVHIRGNFGRGTGFIVSPDGKIVTALHVIEGNMRTRRVQLANGERYDSFKVLAVDKKKDLAVIKIPGSGLPFIEMYNSQEIKQREPVMVIGTPKGFPSLVTTGIVSAIRETDVYWKYWKSLGTMKILEVHTDGAIGPGWSGSPIVNFNGKAIGVHSIGSKLGAQKRGNFAVSIQHVHKLLETVQRAELLENLAQVAMN